MNAAQWKFNIQNKTQEQKWVQKQGQINQNLRWDLNNHLKTYTAFFSPADTKNCNQDNHTANMQPMYIRLHNLGYQISSWLKQ